MSMTYSIRRAKLINSPSKVELLTIQAYLPSNYEARLQPFGHPDNSSQPYIEILGHDNAGWTLDDYVLPRLASGGYFAKEVSSANHLVDQPIVETADRKTTIYRWADGYRPTVTAAHSQEWVVASIVIEERTNSDVGTWTHVVSVYGWQIGEGGLFDQTVAARRIYFLSEDDTTEQLYQAHVNGGIA